MLKSRFASRAKYVILALLLTSSIANKAWSQVELAPWGNITGIRSHGQLFEFESSIQVASKDGKHWTGTAKERQRPHYRRQGNQQIVNTSIDSLFFKETVRDLGAGKIKVSLQISAHADTAISSLFFCITFPSGDYEPGSVHLIDANENPLSSFVPLMTNTYTDVLAKGIALSASGKRLKLTFDSPDLVIVRKDTDRVNNRIQLFVVLKQNGVHKGDVIEKTFTIKALGNVDKTPVNLELNTKAAGRPFDGLGGNFRLQNPKFDPPVIEYCLKNLRVAYGRVEMPWRLWQPKKEIDPTSAADSGKLNSGVHQAMEMARRLDSLGIPFILSAWFPPAWAAEGKLNMRPDKGIWGNPLNKDNMDAIYKSIADYILYLKKHYGAEPKLFSFNESDLGINVRVTAQQHDDFIKGCGAYFAAHGIKTKMLLGDNSDATTFSFIYPTMDDAEARPYIGAVSFHSWRGWDSQILQRWADAATRLNIPLLVGEGSTDAAAWNYPDIFQEQTYALNEINLYIRMLAICQPLSILQWQLTADYSPLIGGGIFGNNEPLHPGERFWNLKQLAITPKGLLAMPISCDKTDVSCAAMGDNGKGVYAIHLVNNGTSRQAVIKGLPAGVKQFKLYVTTKKWHMKELGVVNAENGSIKFKLPVTSYATLISQ